jgi:erythromycin esterase-like protein
LGVYSIGFLGHQGTVTAAIEWDLPPLTMQMKPSRSDSVEYLLHEHFKGKNGILIFNRFKKPGENGELEKEPVDIVLNQVFSKPLLERFIGVVYRPETERWSHYSNVHLAKQFDAVLFYETSKAIEPLPPAQENRKTLVEKEE